MQRLELKKRCLGKASGRHVKASRRQQPGSPGLRGFARQNDEEFVAIATRGVIIHYFFSENPSSPVMSPGGLSIVSVKLRHNNYVFDEKRWGPKNRPTLPRNSQANINQRSLIMYARSNHRSQWSLRPCLSCSGSMMWIA